MKFSNLVAIAALLDSTQAVRVQSHMSAMATSSQELEEQAQWYLFDDIYNWLYCKYRECGSHQQHSSADKQKKSATTFVSEAMNAEQSGTSGKFGQRVSDDSTTVHKTADRNNGFSEKPDGRHSEGNPNYEADAGARGAAILRMSGAQKEGAPELKKEAAPEPKKEAEKKVDPAPEPKKEEQADNSTITDSLSNNLLKSMTQGQNDNVKSKILNINPLMAPTKVDDEPQKLLDKYFRKDISDKEFVSLSK